MNPNRDRLRPSSPASSLTAVQYRHTQIGWVVLGSLAVVLGVVVILTTVVPVWVGLLVAGLMTVVVLNFGSLTVEVRDDAIEARFGIGWIRRRIAFGDVRSFRPVRNSWIYGWGIRVIPGGWMFNISGLLAVELTFHDGRRFRIGTDQPAELTAAIERVLGRGPGLALDGNVDSTPAGSRFAIVAVLSLVFVVLAGVGALLWFESRPVTIDLDEARLSVASFTYRDEIPLATVESVELAERLPALRRRTNGFAAGGKLRGSFLLEDGRSARLYVDRSVPPFIVVRHRDGWLVFNADSPEATGKTFERLRSAPDRVAQ